MATSSCDGGGRPQVSLRFLFQSQAGTFVEPPTLRRLAGKLLYMKESHERITDPDTAQTCSDYQSVILTSPP